MEATSPLKNLPRLLITSTLCVLLAACASAPPHPDAARTTTKPKVTLRPVQIDADQRANVIMTALSLLETKYQWGGSNFRQGFDCSGLVKYVFAQATEADLPHNTAQIARISRPIPRDQLQPGDLVFFNTTGTPNSHMGIYLGQNRFINAPSTGGQVRVDSLNSAYYRRHFESVRTLFAR